MSSFEIGWEYQSLDKKWVKYDRELTTFLKSLPSDWKEADRDVAGWNMRFSLEQMRQRNLDTGFVRSIRCVVWSTDGNNDGAKYVWCYQQGEPRKRWISFPPEIALKLEQSFTKDAQNDEANFEFTLNGREVQIDWKAQMLTVLDTEEERPIKRTESTAGPPDSSNPPHPISSPTTIRQRNRRFQEEAAKKKGRKSAATTKSNSKEGEGKAPKKAKKRGRPKKGQQIESESDQQEEEDDQMEIENEVIDEIVGSDQNENDRWKGTASLEVEDEEKSIQIAEIEEKISGAMEVNMEGEGGPEVDFECRELLGKVRVYVDKKDADCCYDVMLNQTNIQQNNNKFYLMQVLQSNVDTNYWVWFRWGRVGFKGQSKLTPFGSDLDGALEMFHAKFADKTHNEFVESRNNFLKVPGKYDLIKIDYKRKVIASEETAVVNDQSNENDNEASKTDTEKQIDEKVRALMNVICDLKSLERDARKLDYDLNRIPLGKITKEQIHAGYEALSRIERHIQEGKFDRDFKEAVNAYYTRIPHSFGMRVPAMIKTMEELKQEIELLELLTVIEITVAEIAGDPLERHYARLQWELVPLEETNEMFQIIAEYLSKTHGPTHDRYRLQLYNVFELRQKPNGGCIQKRFRDDIGNRKLLWHGSRMANWYSILAQGLRIAPPEAPSTGFMFGKGAYFADISSKSANYSLSDPDRPGFLLLSEVALGDVLDMREADDQMHRKLPEGKHSVRGIGRYIPHTDEVKIIDNNVEVPCGKPIQNAEVSDDASLIYNEYVVYNLDQIRERFLVQVEYKFEFEL